MNKNQKNKHQQVIPKASYINIIRHYKMTMLARLKKNWKTSLKIFALRTGENNMTYLEKDRIEILELKNNWN